MRQFDHRGHLRSHFYSFLLEYIFLLKSGHMKAVYKCEHCKDTNFAFNEVRPQRSLEF